jgi:hypothetical protein
VTPLDRGEASERFQVRKCGYSAKPWRIIDTHQTPADYSRGSHPEGVEVWTTVTIHAQDGPITVPGPLAFDRKRDAVAALDLLLTDNEQAAA